MSRVLYEYITIASNNPANGLAKLLNQFYYPEQGIFQHYETPIGNKKYYNIKLKQLNNFVSVVAQELEYLEKENKSIPNSCKIARDTCESYAMMLEKHKEEMKKKKTIA